MRKSKLSVIVNVEFTILQIPVFHEISQIKLLAKVTALQYLNHNVGRPETSLFLADFLFLFFFFFLFLVLKFTHYLLFSARFELVYHDFTLFTACFEYFQLFFFKISFRSVLDFDLFLRAENILTLKSFEEVTFILKVRPTLMYQFC